jgi:8-oxo-dGTP pyrophosphatase MutT (NUDIX family)
MELPMSPDFNLITRQLEQLRQDDLPVAGATRAAVAMILRKGSVDLEMLFIERAAHEQDPWSGHLAFPGGKVEQGEEPRQAAERETIEEIGLDLQSALYLGRLADIAGANLPVWVSCYVYGMNGNKFATMLSNEVGDLFWVGFADLLDAKRHVIAPVRFAENKLDVPAIILPQPGKPVLWGITYRLVMQLLELSAKR